MEFEVRHRGGIDTCFVSLPFQLIQTLEYTRPSHSILPHLLALELRSLSSNRHWFVSWSGATSISAAIEIAPQFADCVLLPDNERVQVRVIANGDKATLVTIEPESEDDWEVLELNAEQAEAAILEQVRIVQEEMRFPLWLHGRTIITFRVVSTFPKKAVVQLEPGTEVAVAPKRRKKDVRKQDDFIQSSLKDHKIPKALVRVQDSDIKFLRKNDIEGVELGVALTSVAYIHPETAKKFSFNSHQLVTIVPRLSTIDKLSSSEDEALGMKSNSAYKEFNNGMMKDKKEQKDKKSISQAIVCLLLSDSVAKGHLAIAWSLRMHLKAVLHSWVYIKGCGSDWKEDIPMFTLSPCSFKVLGKDTVIERNDVEDFDNHQIRKQASSEAHADALDWSKHYDFADEFCRVSSESGAERNYQHDNKIGITRLLQAWFCAQIDAISSATGVEANSLILGKETLLHFEVKGHDIWTGRKMEKQAPADSNGSLESNDKTIELPKRFLYLLNVHEQSPHDRKAIGYKLTFGESGKTNIGGAELLGKIKFGDPISLHSVKERISRKSFRSNISSLSWMGSTTDDVINRLMVLLSPASGLWLNAHNFPLPGHVLIYGPHGSGKTVLARAVAKSLEEHESILAHIVFVGCSGLSLENASSIRQRLSASISEALDHAPSLIILDDLDNILSSSDSEGSQPSTSVAALTKFFTDIIDEYGEKRKSSCGIGPIAFVATVHTLESIPQSLSSSGRFDFHVQLPAPAASERGAILKHEIQRRSLECLDDVLIDVASKCDGYDAYDLEILVDRAVHAAIGRFLPSNTRFPKHDLPTLTIDDFTQAMHDFLPVAMRDITKSAPEVGRSGWDDVGGLNDIRNAIKEMIELPSKFPSIFSQSPLRLRSNILLYGPPGCGKTHIVGAAAAAFSLRFISVKGPELLNKYIGASEQAVRDIFAKATAAAPCVLFFDEFDSIAPKRGHDNTGVTDRVVNQFLTELDGVEVLTGVFVFAATSRPDLLDAALLRPGRLDRLLFCDFPSPKERLDILTVLSQKLPLADDVDLEAIAYVTEGFSGADLQALLSDAQLEAVHKHLSRTESGGNPGKLPVITDKTLKSIASKARPSISEAEKHRLYGIYSQFLDAKKSVSAQSRDAKGKRATLA